MRRISLIAVLLLSPLALADDKVEPKPSLSLEAEVTKGGDRTGTRLLVRLVNTGKAAVTVVTDKLRVRMTEGDGTVEVVLKMVEASSKGRVVVPAASSLGLVKLQPGEVAAVQVPVGGNQKTLARLGPKTTVTVTYEISEPMGKRFGAWHGKIETKAEREK